MLIFFLVAVLMNVGFSDIVSAACPEFRFDQSFYERGVSTPPSAELPIRFSPYFEALSEEIETNVTTPYPHPIPYYDKDHNNRVDMVPLIVPSNERLLIAVYSLSYCSPEEAVENWFISNDSPARHNPLRLSTVFQGVGVERDELGSSCIGYDFKAEICLQAIDCIQSLTPDRTIWIPTTVVANFRVEAVFWNENVI